MYKLQKDFYASSKFKRPRNSVSCRRMRRLTENERLNLTLRPKNGWQKPRRLQTALDGTVEYHYSRKFETFSKPECLEKPLANRPSRAEDVDLDPRNRESGSWNPFIEMAAERLYSRVSRTDQAGTVLSHGT
jgi:hypothetical protein